MPARHACADYVFINIRDALTQTCSDVASKLIKIVNIILEILQGGEINFRKKSVYYSVQTHKIKFWLKIK